MNEMTPRLIDQRGFEFLSSFGGAMSWVFEVEAQRAVMEKDPSLCPGPPLHHFLRGMKLG
jgi:hypothetical protein